MSKFEFRTFFVYGKVLKADEWTETSFGPVQFIDLEINGELHKAISPSHTFPPGMIQYFIGKEIAVMKMATAEDFKDGIFAVVDGNLGKTFGSGWCTLIKLISLISKWLANIG